MSDLLLDLDASRRPGPAMEAALRGAILSGRLAPGTRLPSSRVLARELGCARATVVGAYEQLVAEGYLVAAIGSGTTVARVGAPPSPDLTSPANRTAPLHRAAPRGA